MPLPDVKTIRHAARTLLQMQARVTPREVRDYLLRQGYFVDHSDIVHWMACLAQQEGWARSSLGEQSEYRPRVRSYDLCCEALGFSSS
ncbi:MAG: hypothetical protein AAFW73_03190 [Bacteroidota bacterium]